MSVKELVDLLPTSTHIVIAAADGKVLGEVGEDGEDFDDAPIRQFMDYDIGAITTGVQHHAKYGYTPYLTIYI